MADSRRVFRVGEQIRSALAMELLKVSDPRFNLVTICHVLVSPDLKSAKIYWTVSTPEKLRPIAEEAFKDSVGYFRKVIGEQIKLRAVPNLKFFYDDTLDTAHKVDLLLARARGGVT